MLRKSYIGRFKEKPFNSMNDFDLKSIMEDDNYILNSNRPLKASEISKIPSEKLEKFVDSVLTDKSLNNLLFSSNAQSEINIIKKSSKSLNARRSLENKTKNKKKDINPQDIVFRRAKNEAISKIIVETKDYKEKRQEKFDDLNFKVFNFYKSVKNEKDIYEQNCRDYTAGYRKKRFLEIFNSVKAKLKEGIRLPHVDLDVKNVYSRLYNNVVYLDKNSQKEEVFQSLSSSGNNGNIITTQKMEITNNNYNDIPNFNVKNVIQNSFGKEFTLKITENEYMMCFSKHSGGPSLKPSDNRTLLNSPQKKDLGSSEGFNNFELLNIKDEQGNSFLHVSAEEELVDLVVYLLVKGVDPNAQNIEGDTPLHIAMRTSNRNVIHAMLESGAEVDIQNKRNETPVDCASTDIKKYFLLDNLLADKMFARKR